MEKILRKIILFIIIFFIFYFIINSFAYLDISNLCYIRISETFSRSNEETIRAAIKLLKRQDREAYQTLCSYVNEIFEKSCSNSEESGSCYIKGSKAIFLKYNSDTSDSAIKQRAEEIKKYANYSKNFWNSLK